MFSISVDLDSLSIVGSDVVQNNVSSGGLYTINNCKEVSIKEMNIYKKLK